MNPGQVAAVVLSWNDADQVIALLERLRAIEPRPHRVVVVDNGSAGGVLSRIAATFPEHLCIGLAENSGFARAVNRGIEAALADGADWVWLLNTDLELPGAALGQLLAAAESDPRFGMSAALLVEADGRVQARGGGRVNLWTGTSRHVLSPRESCHYLTGACLLLRASMLREIGLFDENYFFYWEDVDLGFRARAAGWKMAVAEDCRVVHLEGSSLGRWSERRWYLLFRGMRRFLGVHAPFPRMATTLRFVHHSAAMLKHGRVDAVKGAWRAVAERAKR